MSLLFSPNSSALNGIFFRRWWFFDTNCISHLAKLTLSGKEKLVQRFLADRFILLTSSVLQEMRHCPELLKVLPKLLNSSFPYAVSDISYFLWADIARYLQMKNIAYSELYAPKGLFCINGPLVANCLSGDFEKVCYESECIARTEFVDRAKADRGANVDPRKLRAIIHKDILERVQTWFSIRIPVEDVTVKNFRTFFLVRYLQYYYCITDSGAKVEPNDFNDFQNCWAASYCQRFYTEKRFGDLLRSVSKAVVPSISQVYKSQFKKKIIDEKTCNSKRYKSSSDERSILESTEILKLKDLENALCV